MALRREDGGTLTEIGKVFRESGGALVEIGAVYREENGTLTQVYSASDPPENLSAFFNQTGSNDRVDLSWDPDNSHQQEIWRCQDCNDPSVSGTKIDTVAAGTGSYSDTGPTCDGGRTWVYEIVDTEGDSSNTDSVAEPPCFQ